MDRENEFLTIVKKPPPRKGRRAGISLLNPREGDRPTFEDESRTGGPTTSSHTPDQPLPPPRARRSGGWANEDSKSKKRLPSTIVSDMPDTPSQKFQPIRGTAMVGLDSDDELPNLPELDNFGGEVLKSDVHYKKLAAMKRVAAYKELDETRPSYLTLDGIDLSLLGKCLDIEAYPHIQEDSVLSWDALFTEVKSELRYDEKCNDQADISSLRLT